MNRKEHLAWAKKRALEYVELGDLPQAFASLTSDLGKHEDTRDHCGIELGVALYQREHLSTADKMRSFINGFQ